MVMNVCTNVFVPTISIKVAVLLTIIFVLTSKPQTLRQKVSVRVAVAGLKADDLASAKDGAEAAAGVKINDLEASPRRSVRGNRVIGVELCAAATVLISEKYVTRYTGR